MDTTIFDVFIVIIVCKSLNKLSKSVWYDIQNMFVQRSKCVRRSVVEIAQKRFINSSNELILYFNQKEEGKALALMLSDLITFKDNYYSKGDKLYNAAMNCWHSHEIQKQFYILYNTCSKHQNFPTKKKYRTIFSENKRMSIVKWAATGELYPCLLRYYEETYNNINKFFMMMLCLKRCNIEIPPELGIKVLEYSY